MIAAKWFLRGQVSLTDCLEVACKAWYDCEVGWRRQEASAETERLGDQGAGRDLGHWSWRLPDHPEFECQGRGRVPRFTNTASHVAGASAAP